jgi:hypothetical protein
MSNARDKANIPALNFSSTGIDDNATSTAITIDSNQDVGIGTTNAFAKLVVEGDSNSNVAVVNAIGTAPNYIFDARDDGTSVFRIDGSGNVGIGTSSPVSDARLTISSDSSESYVFFERSGSGKFDGAIGMTSSNIVFKGGTDSSTVSGLNEFMRIDGGSGNVGIGTSSPTQKLDVRNQAVIGDGTDGVKFTYSAGNSTGIIDTGFTSTGLEFRVENSPKMRIDSSGNVGIGTSSPSRNLHINASQPYLQLTSDATGTGTLDGFQLICSQSDGEAILMQRENAPTTFYTNNSERMRIDSSGNVGIGETTPSSKLHIKNGGQTIENTSGIGNESINFVYARGGGASGITITLATLGTPTTGSYAHARIDWSSIYDTTSDNGGAVSEILYLKYKTDGTYATKEVVLGSVGNFISANFYWDNNVLKVDIPVYTDLNANITITQHSFSSITLNV